LEGFTSPSKKGQLSVFDLRGRRWFETGTAGVGAERGFYDYSPGRFPDQIADDAFSGLESKFPAVRKELISGGFSGWGAQREFLLEYAQMLRVRSRLFREQAVGLAQRSIIAVVEEVVEEPSRTEPGVVRTGLRVKPYVAGDDAQHKQRLRNISITRMRSEIAKGAGLFSDLHWCLRLTEDSGHPVVTADQPVIAVGSTPALTEDVLLRDPNIWTIFPVCWKACLIGNRLKADMEIESFQPSGLRWLQDQYFRADSGFAYAPSRIAVREWR
jgi:hypothetical protein